MDVQNLDPDDIDEIDDLIDESDDEIPQNENDEPQATNGDDSMDDDLVEIGIGVATTRNAITAGIVPTELDQEFSLEYSYTTDVSFNKLKSNC